MKSKRRAKKSVNHKTACITDDDTLEKLKSEESERLRAQEERVAKQLEKAKKREENKVKKERQKQEREERKNEKEKQKIYMGRRHPQCGYVAIAAMPGTT